MPWLFGYPESSSRYYYSDDRFADQYNLRNMNARQKQAKPSWHSVSASGPEAFKSQPRRSDELGIIQESQQDAKADIEGHNGQSASENLGGIKKDVAVSVNRI